MSAWAQQNRVTIVWDWLAQVGWVYEHSAHI
jgi:hypothetical protein